VTPAAAVEIVELLFDFSAVLLGFSASRRAKPVADNGTPEGADDA